MRMTPCLISIVLLVGCSQSPANDPQVAAIVDRFAVEDVVNELFIATDLKDWDRVRAVFAEQVLFDMTSLIGGDPVEITPQSIVEAWEEGLGPVQAVHHQTGNFVVSVDGDAATAFCYGTATHFRPEQEQRLTYFVGGYDFHLVRTATGWKIDGFKFDAKYVE